MASPLQRRQHRLAPAGNVRLQLFSSPRFLDGLEGLLLHLPCGLCLVEVCQGVGAFAQATVTT